MMVCYWFLVCTSSIVWKSVSSYEVKLSENLLLLCSLNSFFLDFLLNVLVKAIAGYYVIVIYLQVLVFVYQLLYFIREKCISPFVGTVAVCTNVCI